MENWPLIFGIGALLLVLGVAILSFALQAAISLFVWAAASGGFIGVALYVILWIVATPLMIVVSLLGGIWLLILYGVMLREERREARIEKMRERFL